MMTTMTTIILEWSIMLLFMMEERTLFLLAVHHAGLSASPSSANAAAGIAPHLSTSSRNGLIAAANEALRVQ
jgi:hypothetical protein